MEPGSPTYRASCDYVDVSALPAAKTRSFAAASLPALCCSVSLLIVASAAWTGYARLFPGVMAGTDRLLEGTLAEGPLGMKYVGGFCFGHRAFVDAQHFTRRQKARLLPRVEGGLFLEGSGNASGTGIVTAVFYDDEGGPLELMQRKWSLMSYDDIIRRAKFRSRINVSRLGAEGKRTFFRRTYIIEKYNRHWHVLLLSKDLNLPTGFVLKYEVGARQALARWAAGEGVPASCPASPWDVIDDAMEVTGYLRT